MNKGIRDKFIYELRCGKGIRNDPCSLVATALNDEFTGIEPMTSAVLGPML